MADIRFSDLTAAAVSDVTAATSILPISIPGGAAPISRKLTFATLVTWLSTVGMIATVITAGGFSSTAGKVSLGTAPGTTAAINVDASGYATTAFATVNGTATTVWNQLTNGVRFGTTSASHSIFFQTGNTDRWQLSSISATSEMIASQGTARIVGGATNGLAIRNSANTKDNFQISDSGSFCQLAPGSALSAKISVLGASGECGNGGAFSGGAASSNGYLLSDSAVTTGQSAGIVYGIAGALTLAVNIMNVAAGFGTLDLMKSGGSVISGGSLTSSNATAGNGYSTGAGGTVVQATSKATGVTLNNVCGAITMQAAALAAAAKISFVVTNSVCAATDVPAVTVTSGGTANAYRANVTAVAAGSFTITVENITAGSLSESPVIAFAINKAVTA
jgi:hypothetical protein